MRSIINYIKSYWVTLVVVFAAIASLVFLITYRQYVEREYFPNVAFDLQEYEHFSTELPSTEKGTIIRSRNSTVKIYSTIFLDYPPFIISATGTGVYVTYDKNLYVLTAAHMVGESCDYLFVATPSEESTSCYDVVYYDEKLDIALLEMDDQLLTVTPALLDSSLNMSKHYPIGEQIYYTGYPNDSGRLTIKGQIAGYTHDKFLLQSYAWHGASGSGIFSINGDLIGIVSAIQIGHSGATLELIETIVYGAPVAAIDFSMIQSNCLTNY